MEGDEQRRRQHEQPIYPRGYAPTYAAQSTNVSNPQQLRGAVQGDGSDRFRQAQLLATRAPTSAPLSAGAGVPQDMGSYSYMPAQQYTNPSMQGNQFPYQSDYLQDAQRQRYPQYQSQMMYSAPQQPQSQLSYEPIGGYQPRQTAAVEVLSSQFSVPQQYYNTAETTNTSAPAAIVQGYSTAAYQQAQQSQYSPATTLGGSTLASTYPTLAPDYSQTSKIEEPVQPGQDTDSYGEQLANYQRAICETNDNTSRGRLFEAGSSLMELSNWLLRKAGDLGRLWKMRQAMLYG